MIKRCMVCSQPAEFKIKDTSDYYCRECAEENFADLSMLVNVEEEALRLKELVEKRLNGDVDENDNDWKN